MTKESTKKLSIRNRKMWMALFLGLLAWSCDFQNPSKFETPTWYLDLKLPLTSEAYSLRTLTDNDLIVTTPDSQGFQLVFEGQLPDTSIDPNYLQIPINQDIQPQQDPISSPTVDFALDTTINIIIPVGASGLFDIDSAQVFNVPNANNIRVLGSHWNTLAAYFDTLIEVNIGIPGVDPSLLPGFITSIDKFLIVENSAADTSLFETTLLNNGCPTDVENVVFRLLTDTKTPVDTLASHTSSAVQKDSTFNELTSLSRDTLGTAIQMQIGFNLQSVADNDTITVNAGDSVKINIAIHFRIDGIDGAIVTTAETDLAPDMPALAFPSDIELYSGSFSTNTPIGVNGISVTNLRNTFPFDLDFYLNFRNFIPPAGQDSIKIDTLLIKNGSPIAKTWKLDGYTFRNPDNPDSAVTSMEVELHAVLTEQEMVIPLDGSDLGSFSIRIQVNEFHFDSLQATIIETFPPTSQEMTGMPQGFSGMSFTDVRIEFEMLNQIQLPVKMNIAIVGVDESGDSSRVSVLASMGSPANAADTARTIIRLWREGTTTLIYASPGDSMWTDSTTVPPSAGETNIVQLLSSNPADIFVDAAARIDGRGTIVAGASIGGMYRMIAPFAVRMDEMTFIPVIKTKLEPMAHDSRALIRSSLNQASLITDIVNHIPVGGELAILLSNNIHFPMDTTREMLNAYRDTMVVRRGWNPADSLYIIRSCDSLDPAIGNIYIFNIMDDFSECKDGLIYLVRSTGTAVDSAISYVDTLAKVILPDPAKLYSDTSSTHHPGAVLEPGRITYTSTIDTTRIQLMTDPGDHYVVPRFHLNGSDGRQVFISYNDYISIISSVVFRISSTGMFATQPTELVLQYPNGGESLPMSQTKIVRWKTFGKSNQVNLHYGVGMNLDPSDEADWGPIAIEIANVDSFLWTPITTPGIFELSPTERDSLRLKISIPNKTIYDVSGWYFRVTEGGQNASGNPIISGKNARVRR